MQPPDRLRRMTGYGQHGPLAQVPGHDINYIAIAGALGMMARRGERPLFPLNLLGDYGGGGMLLALGIVCAVLEARSSGQGQVVDAAMIDGVAQLATLFFSFHAAGAWDEPGTNILDSGAPFYDVYETADGRYMAVGAIEPQFYAALLSILGIAPEEAPQHDRDRWPELSRRFAEVFRTRTRADWTAVFEQADACTTPVLSLDEAIAHPHNASRGVFIDRDGVALPASAPRFSRAEAELDTVPDAAEVLRAWGVEGRGARGAARWREMTSGPPGVGRFPFAFADRYRRLAWCFGATPSRAWVTVDDEWLRARFGPWRVTTMLTNVAAVRVTGPYAFSQDRCPARLALTDRGLTFATNPDRGVLISFRELVAGLEPTGLLRHPELTVTVADVEGLASLLRRRIGSTAAPRRGE